MTALKPDTALEDIRREIDAIDDAILDLVIRRFETTAKVRASKSNDGSLATSPLRPAREALILRRLIARGSGRIDPQLLVRLWRVILSASSQAQAPITIHVERALVGKTDQHLAIAEHFRGMSLEAHGGLAGVFAAIAEHSGDLAVVATGSPWVETFLKAADHGARLIASLPMIGESGVPQLLIFGHAEPQPSGHDETVMLSRGKSAADAAVPVRWQAICHGWTVTSLPGFLAADAPAVTAFLSHQQEAQIAGRFPSPIEVSS